MSYLDGIACSQETRKDEVDRRRVARNDTRNHPQITQMIDRKICVFVGGSEFRQVVAGEQMRHGLKPCDVASEAVAKPTRFLVEM